MLSQFDDILAGLKWPMGGIGNRVIALAATAILAVSVLLYIMWLNPNDIKPITPQDQANASYYNNAGDSAFKNGDYGRAVRDFGTAIQLNPQEPLYYDNRGLAYQNLGNKGDLERSIVDFSKAIKLYSTSPGSPEFSYNGRGYSYYKMRNFKRAISDFDKAIKLNSKKPNFFINRGWAYRDREQEGDFKSAIEDFSHVIDQLNPKPRDAADAYYGRGYTYLYADQNNRNLDKAISNFTEAIKIDSKNPWFFIFRGAAFSEKDQFPNAFADYKQAISLDPNDAEAYNQRGWTFIRRNEAGDIDSAIKDFSTAIDLKPKMPEYYESRAAAYDKKGESSTAASDLDEARRLRKLNPSAQTQSQDFRLSVGR